MKTIQIYEKVLVGNFAGETTTDQRKAANNYCEMMKEKISGYCESEYPEHELKVDFDQQNASGYSPKIDIYVDNNDDECDYDTQETILNQIEFFQNEISQIIYED